MINQLSEDDKQLFKDEFIKLAHALRDKNVTLKLLTPIFNYLGLNIKIQNGNIENQSTNSDSKTIILCANLIYRRKEMERFLIACGLEIKKNMGKGSHYKVIYENKTIWQTSKSERLFLKKVIKILQQHGVPNAVIIAGLKRMKIAYFLQNN